MVSVGVSKLGCTELVFVDSGTKINGAYYRDILLRKKLLLAIRRVSGKNFIFQQDTAAAHEVARAQLQRRVKNAEKNQHRASATQASPVTSLLYITSHSSVDTTSTARKL